MSVVEMSVD
jgi:pentapeptide MXKDX repeat protein